MAEIFNFSSIEKKEEEHVFFRSCDFNFNFYVIFSKMRKSISTLLVILCLRKFCVNFLVELHLDVVLEVLLVVGLDFLTLVDKYQTSFGIHRKKEVLATKKIIKD